MRQKRAAIERALAREKAVAGAISNGGDSANVTRSSVGSGGATSSNGIKKASAEKRTASGEVIVIDGGVGERGGGREVSLEDAGISAKEIKNIFTELRKGANHPLMLLNYFKGGGKTEEVVDVLHRTGYFGAQATRDMVSE